MKKRLIPMNRVYAFAKRAVGRSMREGESPVDVAANELERLGYPREGRRARVFVEAHRDVILSANTTASPREHKTHPASADSFLSTYEWRRLRMQALKKYGARCQCCGAKPSDGAVMNVDHIKPRKLFPELALSLDNLQVLCAACNHGKGNWDMTDWRAEEGSTA